MQDDDYLVMKALAKILIRKGIISRDEIHDAAEDLERTGMATAAQNLTMLALEAETMTASEFEADYRRRQMVERTALLSRNFNGGKPTT